MTTPSEQWIVGALRQATDRMPLPPESRWIRERRSTPRVSTIAVVGAAAILIVAIGMTIGALRIEPRLVPATGPNAFAVAEDNEWRIARFAVASDLVLLRPAWVPSEFRGSAECPSPRALIGLGALPSRQDPSSYSVSYQRPLPNGSCGSLVLYGQLGTQDDTDLPDGLIETTTFNARGTTVHVRSGVLRTNVASPPPLPLPLPVIQLWWNEPGAHYDVMSNDLELVDLVRVIRSLEPVRREP
jgi:hypothetical protein